MRFCLRTQEDRHRRNKDNITYINTMIKIQKEAERIFRKNVSTPDQEVSLLIQIPGQKEATCVRQ